MVVRPLGDADRSRAGAWIRERWGDEVMAAHGEVFSPADHEGFVAEDWEGLVTYRIAGDACEVTLLEADPPGRGTGTRLLDAVIGVARERSCRRVWLVTTNDNLEALAWYERRGFGVTAVRHGAVDRARATVKPSIPTHNAANGLPIRDEVELTLDLSRSD